MRSPIYMAKLQSIKAGLCRPAEKGRIKGMTSYRRLISYIYAYEGKTKGKNIGFAKLESRNGQCKLSVNVKKVYVGGSDLGVYLLSPEKEICLGTIFIRGGTGEFRTSVSIDNVAESGIPMDRCYGLSIHEKEDAWRSYATIWEDEVAQAAEVELAEVTSEKVGDPNEQIHKKIEALEKEIAENESAEADIAVAQTEDKGRRPQSPLCRNPNFLPRNHHLRLPRWPPLSPGDRRKKRRTFSNNLRKKKSYWEIPRSSGAWNRRKRKAAVPRRCGRDSGSAVRKSRPLTVRESVKC